MKKYIIWILIVVGILGLFLWGGKKQISNSSDDSNKTETKLVNAGKQFALSEDFYDFGTISMKNGMVTKSFTVTNTSREEAILKSLTTSCMCTNVYIVGEDGKKRGPFGMPGHGGTVPKANERIGRGESREIEVAYDPNAHGPAGVGMINRLVFLESESGEILELKIKVNVTP